MEKGKPAGFNEAEAICLGKCNLADTYALRSARFNEAEAICLGKWAYSILWRRAALQLQ